jgi:hypothetical protein
MDSTLPVIVAIAHPAGSDEIEVLNEIVVCAVSSTLDNIAEGVY